MNEDVCQLAQRLITPAEETGKTVATALLNYRGMPPKDTGFERGHEANEIDTTARNLCISELGHRFPEYDGKIWTEDHPVEQRSLPMDNEDVERRRLLFVIDE